MYILEENKDYKLRMNLTSRIMLLQYTTHLATVSYPNIDLETPMKAVSRTMGIRGLPMDTLQPLQARHLAVTRLGI